MEAVVVGLLVQGGEEDRGAGVPPWGQVVVVARAQQTLEQLVAVGEERPVLEAEVGVPQQVVVVLLVRTQAEEAQQRSIPRRP